MITIIITYVCMNVCMYIAIRNYNSAELTFHIGTL